MHFKCIIECQNVDMSSEQQSYYFRALHYIKIQSWLQLTFTQYCLMLIMWVFPLRKQFMLHNPIMIMLMLVQTKLCVNTEQ